MNIQELERAIDLILQPIRDEENRGDLYWKQRIALLGLFIASMETSLAPKSTIEQKALTDPQKQKIAMVYQARMRAIKNYWELSARPAKEHDQLVLIQLALAKEHLINLEHDCKNDFEWSTDATPDKTVRMLLDATTGDHLKIIITELEKLYSGTVDESKSKVDAGTKKTRSSNSNSNKQPPQNNLLATEIKFDQNVDHNTIQKIQSWRESGQDPMTFMPILGHAMLNLTADTLKAVLACATIECYSIIKVYCNSLPVSAIKTEQQKANKAILDFYIKKRPHEDDVSSQEYPNKRLKTEHKVNAGNTLAVSQTRENATTAGHQTFKLGL